MKINALGITVIHKVSDTKNCMSFSAQVLQLARKKMRRNKVVVFQDSIDYLMTP